MPQNFDFLSQLFLANKLSLQGLGVLSKFYFTKIGVSEKLWCAPREYHKIEQFLEYLFHRYGKSWISKGGGWTTSVFKHLLSLLNLKIKMLFASWGKPTLAVIFVGKALKAQFVLAKCRAIFSAHVCHEKCCTRCSSQFSPSSSLRWCCRAAVAMKMRWRNVLRRQPQVVRARRTASAWRMRVAVTSNRMALRWKMQSQPRAPPGSLVVTAARIFAPSEGA